MDCRRDQGPFPCRDGWFVAIPAKPPSDGIKDACFSLPVLSSDDGKPIGTWLQPDGLDSFDVFKFQSINFHFLTSCDRMEVNPVERFISLPHQHCRADRALLFIWLCFPISIPKWFTRNFFDNGISTSPARDFLINVFNKAIIWP